MEEITRLVDDSMARHGFAFSVDHRRLSWSPWFRCDSSFSLLLVPSVGGIYTLAEEVVAPGETASMGGKRMLAVFQIAETEDLCITLSRNFAPRGLLHTRMSSGRCFVRFSMVADAECRHAVCKTLNQWLASSAEAATGMGQEFITQELPQASKPANPWASATDSGPPTLPSGF